MSDSRSSEPDPADELNPALAATVKVTASDVVDRVPSAAPPTAARQAAGGGLAIAGAKVAFILLGFVQQLLLQWLLGTDGYGDVSHVLVPVGIVNNVVVAASIQGVSRTVSGAPPERAAAALAATLRVHVVLALAVSAVFALSAGLIADAMGASHVTVPLRLVAGVVLMYGVYAPLIGSLNGRRRFGAQASLDVSYTMLRTVGLCGGAWLFLRSGGSGVLGASAGFVASAVIIAPIAASLAGVGKRGPGGPSARHYLASLGPIALGQALLNLLMQTDLLVLSHYAGTLSEAAGLGVKPANELVGVYRSVQLFAFLPYQLLMSISFVLFPMLARADAEQDHAAVKSYAATGVRLALVMTGLMCGTIAGLAPHVLRLLPLKDVAAAGGTPLRILSLGMGSFAIFGIVASAITSLRRERITALLTAVAVAVLVVACVLAAPSGGLGVTMLARTATASAISLTLAAIAASITLQRISGGFAPLPTLARVLLAIAVTVAVGSRLPWLGKAGVVLEAAAMAGLYLGVLVVTRELGGKDVAVIKGALGKRKA